MKRYFFTSLLLVASLHAHAAVISADATGFISDEIDFWGISFDSGSGFIQSATFNLTPLRLLGITFDFNPATAPSLAAPVIGATTGLSAREITADFSGTTTSVLTLSFSPGSFEANERFRFRADTDGTRLLSNPSGELHTGLLFTVIMEDGTTTSGNFNVISRISSGVSQSGVTVSTASPVALPAGIWLFGSGLLAMLARRKTRG